jgi:hypothetical protein
MTPDGVMTCAATVFAIILSGSSCRSTDALSTFNQMHAAACRGDSEAFFANVDLDSVVDNVIRRHGAPLGREPVRRNAASVVDSWKVDMSTKRENGSICHWRVVGTESSRGFEGLEIATLSHQRKRLWFRLQNDRAVLVDYDPIDTGEGTIE